MKLGLENIMTLLTALDSPESKYLKVQVAGTNGKGSVCAFLDSICVSAGIKTGAFTSPHLISITERVRIDGIDITEVEFARHATVVRQTAEILLGSGELEYLPTFFEQITAIALFALLRQSAKSPFSKRASVVDSMQRPPQMLRSLRSRRSILTIRSISDKPCPRSHRRRRRSFTRNLP